jgi:cell division septation protein DedD
MKRMKLLRSLVIPHHTNTYKPHLIRRHGLALVLALVMGLQQLSGLQVETATLSRGDVLGYASNITAQGLLQQTNNERVAQGLKALSLNGALNSAAQSKANHMIANDYWSHVAPDGTTPWYFFEQAGYSYAAAGENLAYGFDTSSGTVAGWMASTGHRANILTVNYQDVGFGIANGSDFQDDKNTVVVALYGEPTAESQPVAAAAPTAEKPPTEPAPQQTAKPTPAKQQKTKTTPPKTEQPKEVDAEKTTVPLTVIQQAPTEEHRISNFEALLRGQAHWSLYTTLGVLLLVAGIYLYRHVLFVHNSLVRGERFVAAHPLLEASLIYIVIALLLSGTHGAVF